MDERALAGLQELGFSLSDARVYLGLLTYGVQNGNELSQSSGVPSSKIYAILKRLASEGVVNHVRTGNNTDYVCIPPAELLKVLRARYMRPLETLEEILPSLAHERPDLDVVQISNAEAVMASATELLNGATEDVYISLWEESLPDLHDALAAADVRGVKIFGMLYGGTAPEFGIWEHHSYRVTVASRIGGHLLTLVADGREALVGYMADKGGTTGIHTRNPVLCLVVNEYLTHDLTLQKAKSLTGYDEWDRWLHTDEDIRAITFRRTGRESEIDPWAPDSDRSPRSSSRTASGRSR